MSATKVTVKRRWRELASTLALQGGEWRGGRGGEGSGVEWDGVETSGTERSEEQCRVGQKGRKAWHNIDKE